MKWSEVYSFTCLNSAVGANEDEQVAWFSRVVFCNQPHLHTTRPYKYPGNYVSTTKYSFLTFLPKALFEQFRRVANLYFLLAAALSLTHFSPFRPIPQIAPLAIVVFVSVMKEAVEDWRRFIQDRIVNSRRVMVHSGDGIFVYKLWQEVVVGDVVKVTKEEYFPSDLILLSSSHADGACYVETVNLDGETSLKFKRSLEETASLDDNIKFSDFQARVESEDPNPDLYTFVGNLEVEASSKIPLSTMQLLLRESKLRNTDFIYGSVIFTGTDTKAVRNSTESPSKRSSIERKLDCVICLLFGILVLLSLITSFGSALSLKSKAQIWYLNLLGKDREVSFDPRNVPQSFFSQLVRALILYGYIVPISLYVSLEVVKVLQALLINKDEKLYDESAGKGVVARTSNLNEELGQVEMILSDKTGTLTCNQMEFKKCSIEGTSYGGEITEVDLAASRRINMEGASTSYGGEGASSSYGGEGTSTSYGGSEITAVDVEGTSTSYEARGTFFRGESSQLRRQGSDSSDRVIELHDMPVGSGIQRSAVIKGFNFQDSRLLDKTWIYRSNVYEMIMFFRVMSLCHTGIPVEDGKFESESPEEVAFLVAAQEFGFKFIDRTQSLMAVEEIDPLSGTAVRREFRLLNLLEFTSARKRMSVIVGDEHGEVFLFCKGADNVIFDRLGDGGRTYQSATMAHLSSYAEDGLRTLAFAYRTIGAKEYKDWNQVFANAKATIGADRDGLLQAASDMIEKDLLLLGAVAVEDKLQQGVPQCIDKLAQAGLKIWLLTGDKRETAVNVGFSCSLLRQDMKQFHLSLSREAEQIPESQAELLLQIKRSYEEISERNRQNIPSALIVDGTVLETALRREISNCFFELAVKCDSVICCRVSPKQKALITRLVKEFTGKTTLAIGDGANDVGMIQEAHIGIGISGAEGMQAVMASDFSLPQFRFLERLLIVHGHWCYKRIAKLILYFVYKNVAFGLTLFYHEVYTMFSGEDLYDDWYMVLYNLLLTSLPVIVLGVLDKDVSASVCLKFPALYQQGQRNSNFSWKAITGWLLNSVLSSIAIYSITARMISPAAFRRDGHTADGIHAGTIMYTCIIWTVNCQIALITTNLNFISHVAIWGSISSWYIYLLVFGMLPPHYSGGVFHLLLDAIGGAPIFWWTCLVVVVASLLPYLVYSTIQRHFYPTDDEIIQEMIYCKEDVMDYPMWLGEQHKSKSKTQVGFSSRVDAKIQHIGNTSTDASN